MGQGAKSKTSITRSLVIKLNLCLLSCITSLLWFSAQASCISWSATDNCHSESIRSTLRKLNVVEDKTVTMVWILSFQIDSIIGDLFLCEKPTLVGTPIHYSNEYYTFRFLILGKNTKPPCGFPIKHGTAWSFERYTLRILKWRLWSLSWSC